MPYDAKDPRASLTPGSTGDKTPTDFAGTEYVKFYETPPDEASPGVKTWYARGQNLIIAYTEASVDTIFSRTAQPDGRPSQEVLKRQVIRNPSPERPSL